MTYVVVRRSQATTYAPFPFSTRPLFKLPDFIQSPVEIKDAEVASGLYLYINRKRNVRKDSAITPTRPYTTFTMPMSKAAKG